MGPPVGEVASQGNGPSVEIPREIEADVPVIAAARTARQRREGGGEVVGEVELERVAAHALLDAEAHVVGGVLRRTSGVDALEAGQTGRELAGEVRRGAEADAGPQADE